MHAVGGHLPYSKQRVTFRMEYYDAGGKLINERETHVFKAPMDIPPSDEAVRNTMSAVTNVIMRSPLADDTMAASIGSLQACQKEVMIVLHEYYDATGTTVIDRKETSCADRVPFVPARSAWLAAMPLINQALSFRPGQGPSFDCAQQPAQLMAMAQPPPPPAACGGAAASSSSLQQQQQSQFQLQYQVYRSNQGPPPSHLTMAYVAISPPQSSSPGESPLQLPGGMSQHGSNRSSLEDLNHQQYQANHYPSIYQTHQQVLHQQQLIQQLQQQQLEQQQLQQQQQQQHSQSLSSSQPQLAQTQRQNSGGGCGSGGDGRSSTSLSKSRRNNGTGGKSDENNSESAQQSRKRPRRVSAVAAAKRMRESTSEERSTTEHSEDDGPTSSDDGSSRASSAMGGRRGACSTRRGGGRSRGRGGASRGGSQSGSVSGQVGHFSGSTGSTSSHISTLEPIAEAPDHNQQQQQHQQLDHALPSQQQQPVASTANLSSAVTTTTTVTAPLPQQQQQQTNRVLLESEIKQQAMTPQKQQPPPRPLMSPDDKKSGGKCLFTVVNSDNNRRPMYFLISACKAQQGADGQQQQQDKTMAEMMDAKKMILDGGGACFDLDQNSAIKRAQASSPVYVIAARPSKSVKYLWGLATGVPIVSYKWIVECVHQNKIIGFNDYLLPAGRDLGGVIQPQKLTKFLFSTVRVFVAAGCQEFFDFCKTILESSGATVLPLSFVSPSNQRRAADATEDDLATQIPTVRFILAESSAACQPSATVVRSANAHSKPIVTADWLMQCLICSRVMTSEERPVFQWRQPNNEPAQSSETQPRTGVS